MKLRPYQLEAEARVFEVWDYGIKNALAVLATGLGKTVIFSDVVRKVLDRFGGKALVVAHRRELVQQAADKYKKVDPAASVGIYQGKRKEIEADVICASVQSCYPDTYDEDGNLKRRGRINDLPLDEISIIVIDEAHHAPAPSYIDMIEAVREANPEARLLGVTATPYRKGDGLGVLWNTDISMMRHTPADQITGVLAFSMGIQAGVESGYLCPLRSFAFDIQVDLSDVSVTKSGEFDEMSLAEKVDQPAVRQRMIKIWKERCGPGTEGATPVGRLTASFHPGVNAAKAFVEDCRAAGIPADWVSGETKFKRHRENALAAFDRGEIAIIANCGVLTEGWDSPRLSAVMLGRPCRSKGLYAQMLGRGTRLMGYNYEESVLNGKSECLVLEFARDEENPCGLASIADLGTAQKTGFEPEVEDILDLGLEKSELEVVLFQALASAENQRVKVIGVVEYEIDLFAQRVAFAKVNGAKVACAARGVCAVVFQGGNGWNAIAVTGDRYKALATAAGEQEAMAKASAFCLSVGDPKYLNPTGEWTRRRASQRQQKMLISLYSDCQFLDVTTRTSRPLPADPPSVANLSTHLASVWISYLHCRRLFASNKARKAAA